MGIDFYYLPGSAPCRAVLLAAKAIGVDLNLKLTDLMKGEHMTPEFLAINPQHTIPTLVDNGFALWESRAIIVYLQNAYGKDDSLYPNDPKKRAVVDQRLYYDITLYTTFGEIYYPVIFSGGTHDPEKLKKLDNIVQFFDIFLAKSEFAAGDQLTLADFSLAATISTLEAAEYNLSAHKNIQKWYAKVKTAIPAFDEINGEGIDAFKQLIAKAKQ